MLQTLRNNNYYIVHYKIAFNYLVNRRRQTATSVLAAALGVILFIVVSALVNGNELAFIEQAINTSPHIVVTEEEKLEHIQPADILYPDNIKFFSSVEFNKKKKGITNAYGILEDISSNFYGTFSAPVLSNQIFIRNGVIEEPSLSFGIIPDLQSQISNIAQYLVSGSYIDLNNVQNGIILGIDLAEKLQTYIGDKLILVSSAGNKITCEVVGIFKTGISYTDYNFSYINLKKAQELFGKKDYINELQITLLNVDQADELAETIQSRYFYPAKSWTERSANVFNVLKVQRFIAMIVMMVILFVASISIYNVISTIVHEKYRDIAIFKSIGFGSSDIKMIFLIQGFIISIIGLVVGWIMAYILIYLLGYIKIDFVGFVKTDRLQLFQSVTQYLIAGSTSLISCLIATIISIRRGVNVNPVDIIRVSI